MWRRGTVGGSFKPKSVRQVLTEFNLPWSGTMEQSCPTCVRGKLAQKPFSSKEKRRLANNQLPLVINYMGLMHEASRNRHTGCVNMVVEPFHLDMVYNL